MSCKDCNEVTLLSGTDGVGIQTIVNNGDGTFTIFLTDGSSFTTANFTGPRGEDGANSGRWKFDSTAASPGAPNVQTFITDSLNLSTIANISINYESITGAANDYQTWATNIRLAILAGKEVQLQIASLEETNVIGIYQVTSGTVNVNYIDLVVSMIVGTGTLNNTKQYAISYVTSGPIENTLYSGDDTITAGRIATLGGSLTWTGGQEIRTVNSRIFKEVTQASDLPTTLVTNTTYIIRGAITFTNNITCTVDGVEIIGLDRNEDHMIWGGTGAFLTLTDCNFGINNIRFSSTVSGNSILAATNVAGAGFNNNRLKVLTIFNCQFRGTFDVMDIKGFDLVDINNTLFFYIKATNFGLRFEDTSKIQITSCELIRWFDESTIPTPSGWATVSMIELQANNLASFGAVNINGCVIHPQETQNGIEINTGSTTGFGTISSNAFVNVELTTGEIFLPVASGLPDYSQTATYNYDVFANQGILNSTSGCVGTLSGNGTPTATSGGIQDVNTNGGAATQAAVRFTVDTAGVATYNGTKQVYCSIHASVTVDSTGNDGTYELTLWKDDGGGFALLPGSEQQVEFDSTGGLTLNIGSVAINYGALFNNGDQLKIRIEKVTAPAQDCTVVDFQLVIRE